MNFSLIAFLLGRLSLALSAILLLPVGLAIFYEDGSFVEFAITSFTAFFVGLGFVQYGKFDEKENISLREGFATVVFSWILTCIICALPYAFLQILDPISAVFESMSGLTTTGATAITNLAAVPKTVLFWRSFTHWLGGIGIIVLFIALLPQVAGGSVHLFNAEVSGFGQERLLPRIRTTAGALFFIYCLFTVIGTGFLVICGMTNFDAINHSMSAIATGGFSTYDNSAMHYNSVSIEVVLAMIMFLGGGNFALYYAVTQRGIKTLWRDSEFKSYMMIIAVLTLLITLNLFFSGGLQFFEGLRCAILPQWPGSLLQSVLL
jgi:trk system potassium uptake protein